MSMHLPSPSELVPILVVLNAAAVFGAAGVAWHLQLAGYPLHLRVGRSGFPRYLRAHRGATALVLAPLVLADFLTSWILLLLPHDPVTTIFVWCGALSALLVTGVTLGVMRRASRRLAEAFEARAFRRLMAGNCVRANVWSMHAALIAVMLVRAMLVRAV